MTAASGNGISLSEIRESVNEITCTVLEREVLDEAVDLFDQGITSVVFIRILALLAEKYGIKIDIHELEEASIDTLSAQIHAQLNGTPLTVGGS